jgi:uncharacterized protein YgiM (DUF1202 family)
MPSNDERARGPRVRVVRAYERSDPDPIVVTAGQVLRVGARDDDYPAWVRITTPSGNSGWMPERDLDRRDTTGTALRDYDATELTVSPGDLLTVVEEEGGWLLTTTPTGERGWVPTSHTEPA